MRIFLFLSCFTACFSEILFAQSSRPIPMLELNADTRTAGMGDANMGGTKDMYLYTNPTAFFFNEGNIYTSYSFGMYPKIDNNRQSLHAVSAGYKLVDRHALMVGFRYLGGLQIPRVNDDGIEGNPIKPMDWSVDFAYSFRFTTNFSAYAGGNVIQSYTGNTAMTGSFSGGIYYNNDFSFSGSDGAYSLGISLYDLGGKVKYGTNGTESDLPTSLGIGGSASIPLHEDHRLGVALSSRYFLLPADGKSFTGGAGLEYELYDVASLRTGYHWGNNAGYFTLGVGCKLMFFNIDAAYSIAKDKNYNLLRVGASIHF